MEKSDIRSHFLYSLYDASLEILGAQEAKRVFLTALGWSGKGVPEKSIFESDFLSDISSEFSIKFHQNTAKGLLVRIGEAAFPFLRKRVEDLNALGSIENRLKPSAKRFSDAIAILAASLTRAVGVEIEALVESDEEYCLEFSRKEKDFSSDMYLYFFGGFLRAFGLWLDSRKTYAFEIDPGKKPDEMNRVCLHVQSTE